MNLLDSFAALKKVIPQAVELQQISGCTNQNMIVSIADVKYLLRLYNPCVLPLRHIFAEEHILKLLHDNNFELGPRSYLRSGEVLLIQYIESDTLENDELLLNYLPQIAQSVRQLHDQIYIDACQFSIVKKQFKDVMLDHKQYLSTSDATISKLFTYIDQLFAKEQPVLCHSDLHSGNIIFDKSKIARFIDFEYAVVYYRMYDVACFFAEACGIEFEYQSYPDLNRRVEFYDAYFGANKYQLEVVEKQLDAMNMLVFGLWSAWGHAAGYDLYATGRKSKFLEVLRKLCLLE